MKESGAIVCKKAQYFLMSDTKDASHTSIGKTCLFAFGFFFNSMPPEALFFLSLLLAPLLSFRLQAVLLGWCVSS
jgi:hypothetical protein